MQFLKVEIDGKVQQVTCEKLGNKTWFHIYGETYCYEPPKNNRSKKGSASGAGGGVVLAPMPGKITKVQTKIGDVVSKGDCLVVMEAMKMEYSLVSDIDGEVEQVSCQVGDQTTHEQVLVIVKGVSSDEPKD